MSKLSATVHSHCKRTLMASQAKLKKLSVSKDGGIIVAHPSSSIRGQIVNILKTTCLLPIAIYRDILVLQCLHDEV